MHALFNPWEGIVTYVSYNVISGKLLHKKFKDNVGTYRLQSLHFLKAIFVRRLLKPRGNSNIDYFSRLRDTLSIHYMLVKQLDRDCTCNCTIGQRKFWVLFPVFLVDPVVHSLMLLCQGTRLNESYVRCGLFELRGASQCTTHPCSNFLLAENATQLSIFL